MRIEVVLDVKTTLGEGPLWDVDQQRLYWIDSFDGRVFRSTADGRELRCWDVPQKIGSMALRKDGEGAILSLERGFYTLDFKTGEVTLIHDPEPETCRAIGSTTARSIGAAGSSPGPWTRWRRMRPASLYRLDPDFSVTRIDSGMTCSNGPCFSPDDKTFYFSDTWTGDIWAYDFDINTGSVSNRRAFVKADMSGGGGTDGSTVDAEGALWNVLVYAGQIVRYTADGKVDRVIEMPVKKVTSVMFGGPNLDILYVTSMAKPPLPRFPGDGVLRGSLFAIHDLGIRGVAEPRFGA